MIQCFVLTNIVLYEKTDKTKAAVLTIIATTDATAWALSVKSDASRDESLNLSHRGKHIELTSEKPSLHVMLLNVRFVGPSKGILWLTEDVLVAVIWSYKNNTTIVKL